MGRRLSYSLHWNGARTAIRAACAKCGRTEELVWNRHNNPQSIAKLFERKGWRFDVYAPSRCVCPVCLGAGGPKRGGCGMGFPNKVAVGELEATPAQKRRIREMLDGQFDEERGCWLDGFSDQSVAEKLDLPRLLVTQVREAAYGPIRSDPEVEAMRSDMAALKREAEQVGGAVAAAMSALDKLRLGIEALDKRLSKCGR